MCYCPKPGSRRFSLWFQARCPKSHQSDRTWRFITRLLWLICWRSFSITVLHARTPRTSWWNWLITAIGSLWTWLSGLKRERTDLLTTTPRKCSRERLRRIWSTSWRISSSLARSAASVSSGSLVTICMNCPFPFAIKWSRTTIFLVCSCLSLNWNPGFERTKRERSRSSRTRSGWECRLKTSKRCPRSKHKFGSRYTTCS